jgi:predicted dithiol-disulfide oxidoreductase (DUF899 family)
MTGWPSCATATRRPRPDELSPALDQHYQDQLESLTLMRRRVAQAATLRKDLERQLAELEPPPDPAGLRQRLAAAIEEEERLTVESQREQMQVDAFRTRKEVLQAAYTAAEAEHLIEQAQGVGDDAVPPDDPAGAAAGLDEIIGQIEQELGLEGPVEGLMELRPGAPADSDIRILFGVEPPGTALLIAVLEGRDAVRDHYREAVLLASEVLQEAQAGPLDQTAKGAAHTFGDARSFLAREKAHTREGDAIAAARRRLPMVELDATTPLTGPDGPVTLLDAFEGRRQLIAYYFMWWDGHPAAEQCEGCTFYTTQVGELSYLHSRDITYAVFCQGPYDESIRYRDFMGWDMPWYSARDSLGTLLTGRQIGLFHLVCYLRVGDRVFETYWTKRRGVEAMDYSYALMDLTVYGRQESWEDSPPGWPQECTNTRSDGGPPAWPPVPEWPAGRPISQWLRLQAGHSDDLTAGP